MFKTKNNKRIMYYAGIRKYYKTRGTRFDKFMFLNAHFKEDYWEYEYQIIEPLFFILFFCK